jgi:Lrp/AsnC family transcriptional regulator for asnA, asnC and gidA
MAQIKMDDIDHQILQILIENCRTPFTEIAKKLLVSAGTVHIRVKKMEEQGIIKGSTLIIDYEKMGYTFIAYVGLYTGNSNFSSEIINEIEKIPEVTVAHLTTGKFSVYCKIRAKNTKHAKDVIFKLSEIDGVGRTESSISLDEVVNDKKRLMRKIFSEFGKK